MDKKKPSNLNLAAKIPKKITASKKEECNFKELKVVSSGCYDIFRGKLFWLDQHFFERLQGFFFKCIDNPSKK